MTDKLTQRQEKFARNLFEGMSQREAWINAGYSTNYSLTTLDSNACRLANKNKVKARLAELNAKADDKSISTVKRRKQILTEIQEASIGDFVDEFGNLAVDREKLRNHAVREIKTERTAKGGIRTTLKLSDPVPAIAEHNRMEKVYEEKEGGSQTIINILVIDKDTKELLGKVNQRVQIQEIPQHIGGDSD